MPNSTAYNYLHLIKYSTLLLWDIKRRFKTQIESSFSVVRLGDYIKEEKAKYNISDKTKTYGILGVNNHSGIFDAYEESGAKIKQKYKKMQVGWIAYNPYRINVGSIGIRKAEHQYEYISSAYVVFRCNEGLVPEYLYLLLKTSTFNKVICESTTGSVRQNLNYQVLSNFQIPLPSIDEQNRIVSAYKTLQEQAKICSTLSYRVDIEIEEYLHDKLGTNIELNLNDSLLSFINYKDVSRWDLLFLLSSSNIHSKYPLVTLNDCINNFLSDGSGVSLRLETQKTPLKEYKYIGMENVEKETGRVVDAPIVKGKEIKSQTIKVPPKYFIYGKLRPYLNKYWYNNLGQEDIICSSEFFVFDIKENINTNYFKYVLASYIVQKQIVDAMSGARMPRISEDIFRSIQIPLPPYDVQNKIVQHISSLREKQKTMREQAIQRRSQSIQQFEQTIFN